MFKILLCGDTICRSADNSDPFTFVHDVFDRHDVVVLNLETTIIENPKKYKSPNKAVIFFSDPANLGFLSRHKEKIIFSLSNNHVLDFGEDGFIETCSNITKWGGQILGINELKKKTFKDYNFEFISFYNDLLRTHNNSSFLLEDQSTINQTIRSMGDDPFVIISAHWGHEHMLIPSPEQQCLAKKWLSSGVNIVMGHHSHSAQGIYSENNGITTYSLGNFNMCDLNVYYNLNVDNISYMLSLELDRINGATKIMSLNPIPFRIDELWRPIPLKGRSEELFKQYLSQLTSLMSNSKIDSWQNWALYYIHISKSYLLNNFVLGWVPRFKRYGISQLWPFLKWTLHKVTIFSLFGLLFNYFNPTRRIMPALDSLLKSLPKENQL